MTYCDSLIEPIRRKIEAGETLDSIGTSFCGKTVLNPRAKAIRLIKVLLGEGFLKKHADTLGYNANRANRLPRPDAKEPDAEETEGKEQHTDEPEQRKIVSNTESSEPELSELVELLNELLNDYTISDLEDALEIIKKSNADDTKQS